MILALFLLLPLLTGATSLLPACTTTISSTSTTTVQSWLATAQPGQVLCLAPGTYMGSANMLTIASAQGGTQDKPLLIRALIDGTVLIDGQLGMRPLDCNGTDVVFQGMNVRNGNDSTLVLRGTRCQVKRVVAWSDWDGADNVIDLGGQGNVIEDVSAFGFARKMVAAGARGGRSNNVLRRVWAEFNGFAPSYEGQGNPTHATEQGYDQFAVTFENVLSRRNLLGTTTTDPQAPFVMFSTQDSYAGGMIAYAQPGDHLDVSMLGHIYPEGGSHAGSGNVNKRNVLTQSLFFAPASFSNVSGLQIAGGSGSEGNVASDLITVAPQPSSCTASGWTCTNSIHVRSLAELGGQSVWARLPGICKTIINKQMTQEGLWPWPMERRTSRALQAAGRPAYSITQTLEQLLGPMPQECRRIPDIEPPDPPVPPQPGGNTLTCTGELKDQGAITMQCQPQTQGR